MAKKKALHLGDGHGPGPHSYEWISGTLRSIVGGDMDSEHIADVAGLDMGTLGKYDLIINYMGGWTPEKAPKKALAAILSYVLNGGGMLGVHCGVVAPTKGCSEINHMFSARFTGHPAMRDITFKAAEGAGAHPIMEGFKPFTVFEEPYTFRMDEMGEVTLLMEFEHEGKAVPGGWVNAFGLGKVAYLVPGHDKGVFEDPGFAAVLRRAAQWAAGIIS
ncbi:MAG: ThuA domain-containing protein [Oscillospiraceae bacterium]|nr:ThuA domain-containing protein [Oscillospiraceae bacterium]